MKKVILFILTATMLFSLCVSVSATEASGNEYQIGNKTIVFEADSAFTVEEQQAIAELLANPENGVAAANILCSVLGHKNTTEFVTAVIHCASATAPRCKQEIYEVTTCSRCDENSVVLVNTIYVSCCPEE